MSIQRDTIKPWFVTGAKPTQAQFWEWLDDVRFNDEAIGMDEVTDLLTTLNLKADKTALDAITNGELLTFDGNGTYDIPAGYLLEKLIVLPTGTDADVQIGKTLAGNEISDTVTVGANVGETFVINIFSLAGTRIYLTGLTIGTKVIIFKRAVPLA